MFSLVGVFLPDRLWLLPPPPASKGIVATAVANKVDAIHPGYGFLSERTDFAQHCKDNGVTFVGPTAENLQTFGKTLAAALGVRGGLIGCLLWFDH